MTATDQFITRLFSRIDSRLLWRIELVWWRHRRNTSYRFSAPWGVRS